MSVPDSRSRQVPWDGEPTTNGSSAWWGGLQPAPPLADQPTEVVHPQERWPGTAASGPATGTGRRPAAARTPWPACCSCSPASRPGSGCSWCG
ncbi:hypothetical protein [Modestobacter sp. SYSU DS0875]